MIAELIAKIVADVTDLDKASVAIRQFESTTKDAFKRTGDLRAGRAIENFIENLTAGNVGGAIESLTSRITGFGLAGSAAMALVGAGVAYLIKNVHEFDAELKAAQANAKATPLAGAALPDIKTHVDATIAEMEKLGNKTRIFWANWAMAIPGTASLAAIEAQSVQLGKLEQDYSNFIAKEREGMEMTALGSAVSARDVEVLKSRITYEENMAKIQAEKVKATEAIGKSHLPEELQTRMRGDIGEEAKNARQIEAERLAALDREVAFKDKLADINREMVAPEIQALEVTKTRIAYLEQVKGTLSASNVEGRKAIDHSIEQLKLDQAHASMVNATKAVKPAFEATQLSLKDILAAPPGTGSVALIEARNAAIRAQREMDLSARYARGGFQEEAFIHQARAEQIKAGIPLLKESEKNPELAFLTAVNSASVFQLMKNYLETIAKSVTGGTNPFLNK